MTYPVPLALRSGGHSFPGYFAGGAPGTGVTPSLVIDTRRMAKVELAGDNTVRIGAGASRATVYDAIGSQGRVIAAGSCATVGITGLTLGGGAGVLVRAYGLTRDSSAVAGELQSFLAAAGSPKSKSSPTHEYRDAMMLSAGCGISPA